MFTCFLILYIVDIAFENGFILIHCEFEFYTDVCRRCEVSSCFLTLNIVGIVHKSACIITMPHENSIFGSKFPTVSSSNGDIDFIFEIYLSIKNADKQQ